MEYAREMTPRIPTEYRVTTRHRLHNLLKACLLLILSGQASASVAQTSPQWKLTGGSDGFAMETNDENQLVLSASNASPGKFGATIRSMDATPMRMHKATLSARLSTVDAIQGASIWLRADGPAGKLAFANSQANPVQGTSAPALRSISIDVPPTATTVVYGVILAGNGKVTAHDIRLERGAEIEWVTAAAELGAALDIVEKNALLASAIDWKTTRQELAAQVGNSGASVEAYPAIRALLEKLGDHHSFLLEPGHGMQSMPPTAAVTAPINKSLGQVAYLAVPGFLGQEKDAGASYANDIASTISRHAAQAQCGWIVDLRSNSGGNMWPMLAGLESLLGTNTLGYFKAGDKPLHAWKVDALLRPVVSGPDLTAAPVAVLIGSRTASSGEAVVIAFRGREKTRSFGAPTAGLPTGNQGFMLPDGATLMLTVSTELDRLRREYRGPLQPDQPVASLGTEASDPVLTAAQAWLQHDGRCTH